jgi:hypothetical protein
LRQTHREPDRAPNCDDGSDPRLAVQRDGRCSGSGLRTECLRSGRRSAMQRRDSRPGANFDFTRILLEVARQQHKLLGVMIKLLGGLSEPRPSQLGELHLQLLDVERLRMDLRGVGRDLDVFARQFRLQGFGKSPQCIWVGRKRITRQGDGLIA